MYLATKRCPNFWDLFLDVPQKVVSALMDRQASSLLYFVKIDGRYFGAINTQSTLFDQP